MTEWTYVIYSVQIIQSVAKTSWSGWPFSRIWKFKNGMELLWIDYLYVQNWC